MKHPVEHCNTPGTAFRRIGSLWRCPVCGQVFVLTALDYRKAWVKTNLVLEVPERSEFYVSPDGKIKFEPHEPDGGDSAEVGS